MEYSLGAGCNTTIVASACEGPPQYNPTAKQLTTLSRSSHPHFGFAMANMNQVMSNLWIGDFEASQNTAELTKHGITHIISASEFARARSPAKARWLTLSLSREQ